MTASRSETRWLSLPQNLPIWVHTGIGFHGAIILTLPRRSQKLLRLPQKSLQRLLNLSRCFIHKFPKRILNLVVSRTTCHCSTGSSISTTYRRRIRRKTLRAHIHHSRLPIRPPFTPILCSVINAKEPAVVPRTGQEACMPGSKGPTVMLFVEE